MPIFIFSHLLFPKERRNILEIQKQDLSFTGIPPHCSTVFDVMPTIVKWLHSLHKELVYLVVEMLQSSNASLPLFAFQVLYNSAAAIRQLSPKSRKLPDEKPTYKYLFYFQSSLLRSLKL